VSGVTILTTGLPVQVDDRYIAENNVEYIIIKVNGRSATAEIISKNASPQSSKLSPSARQMTSMLDNMNALQAQAAKNSHVVIYHTHSDESYAPTSGTTSQPGEGGVYSVGWVLSDTLQKAGISVTHSYANHGPHDINAYSRSRKTLVQLLKEQPDAAFDVHRDSAPAEAYLTTINGVDTSRVMIVVGRSNPNTATNLRYARAVKAQADTLYPGLIRGIFMGHGDYNQDLYPTSLLFEVGTDSIPQSLAENGVRLLGDVLTRIIGG
jgi:stage II sporulation protein P